MRQAKGLLHRWMQGVYLLGTSRPTLRGRWMAAVLYCGPDALLSHRDGAMLRGLYESARRRVDVTAPGRRVPNAHVEPHIALVPPDERDVIDGIPVTGLSRTILDLASVARPSHVEHAIAAAEASRATDRVSLPQLLERYPRKAGRGVVAGFLSEGAARTRSPFEQRFLRFLRRRGLDDGEANATVWVDGVAYELDYLWRDEGLAVELDSRAHHANLASFESDRAKDRALQAAGIRVVRLTPTQLGSEPEVIERDLRRLRAGAGGTLDRS